MRLASSASAHAPTHHRSPSLVSNAGGVGGVAAATALLSEVMPAALDAPLERFIAGLEGQGEATLAGEAAELRWVG
mgnify:CR=1 FL=1